MSWDLVSLSCILLTELDLALTMTGGHAERAGAVHRQRVGGHVRLVTPPSPLFSGEGPKAHIRKLAECIRWSYGAGIVLRLGNIARLELNYCVPMGVQRGDR